MEAHTATILHDFAQKAYINLVEFITASGLEDLSAVLYTNLAKQLIVKKSLSNPAWYRSFVNNTPFILAF